MTVVVQFVCAARPSVQTVEHSTHLTHQEIDTNYLQATHLCVEIDNHHIVPSAICTLPCNNT
jgi:hypothetical protein